MLNRKLEHRGFAVTPAMSGERALDLLRASTGPDEEQYRSAER